MTATAIDRRTALKARHRAAIVDAARALMIESGDLDFSVDSLAARAGVARRTVFNHFASLDEVRLAVCEETLIGVVEDFLRTVAETPIGDGTRASMFAEISTAIRQSDFPTAIARMYVFMSSSKPDSKYGIRLVQLAFARVSQRLIGEVLRRNPGADEIDAQLLVSALVDGVCVIANAWTQQTSTLLDAHDGVTATARSTWNELLERLITTTRDGYGTAR